MAIYHFSAKVIGRSSGRSAVAAAAYRSASALLDEREARTHDFSHKADVVHSEILLPDGAPERWADRGVLWNAVEAAEKRKDAQLAREVEFALPRELSREEGVALARDFVAAHVRLARDGGGPERALAGGRARRSQAARACHADDARGRAGGVRPEGAGVEQRRRIAGLA